MKAIFLLFIFAGLTGCSSTLELPDTDAERRSSFTYIPLDPLPVEIGLGCSCDNKQIPSRDILEALPDQTVRMAIKKFNVQGRVSYAAFAASGKNESYEIILDYMNTDTAPGAFFAKKTVDALKTYKAGLLGLNHQRIDYKVGQSLPLTTSTPPNVIAKFHVVPYKEAMRGSDRFKGYSKINIPIYVGLGLRIRANITTMEAGVNLSGLPAIALQAKAGKVRGSLVVQTLGVSGKDIATVLPLPSELNETTLINSILAMGAIKTMIHDGNTQKTARIVGFYNSYGGSEEFVNALIGALSESSHLWRRTCVEEN
jgi:hypothetical protein